jgi:hypothetical protein
MDVLGWNQSKLAKIITDFGFPIAQQEISLLVNGRESVPTKSGFREVRRKAKDPHWLTGLSDRDIPYRVRVKLVLYRLGFVFPDAKTVLWTDPNLFDFWIKEAASQAGHESNFDGSDNERDSERLWKNVHHYVERLYPDLNSQAQKSADEFRDLLDTAMEGMSEETLANLASLEVSKQ